MRRRNHNEEKPKAGFPFYYGGFAFSLSGLCKRAQHEFCPEKKKAAFQLKQRSFLVQFSIRLRPSKHTESLAWNSEGSTSSCRWKAECIAVKVGERRRRRLVVVTICFSLHQCHQLFEPVCCHRLLVLLLLDHLSLQTFKYSLISHAFIPRKLNFSHRKLSRNSLTWKGLTETRCLLCVSRKLNEELNDLFPLHCHNIQANGAVPGGQDTSSSLFFAATLARQWVPLLL